MEKENVVVSEAKKLRLKQTELQIKFPELYRSDVSIYPSYTNLRLPYQVICRVRKNAYRDMQWMRQQMEIAEIALQQLRAWDGIRLARIFDVDQPGRRKREPVVPKVPDPLTPKERQRLNRIISFRDPTN